jgi:hypothetical protein
VLSTSQTSYLCTTFNLSFSKLIVRQCTSCFCLSSPNQTKLGSNLCYLCTLHSTPYTLHSTPYDLEQQKYVTSMLLCFLLRILFKRLRRMLLTEHMCPLLNLAKHQRSARATHGYMYGTIIILQNVCARFSFDCPSYGVAPWVFYNV